MNRLINELSFQRIRISIPYFLKLEKYYFDFHVRLQEAQPGDRRSNSFSKN